MSIELQNGIVIVGFLFIAVAFPFSLYSFLRRRGTHSKLCFSAAVLGSWAVLAFYTCLIYPILYEYRMIYRQLTVYEYYGRKTEPVGLWTMLVVGWWWQLLGLGYFLISPGLYRRLNRTRLN